MIWTGSTKGKVGTGGKQSEKKSIDADILYLKITS